MVSQADAVPVLDRLYSREEYRQWYDAQAEGRFERVDGRVVAMAAERVGHARIKFAIAAALDRAVRDAGLPCEMLPDGIGVETTNSDFEPDALVNCGSRVAADATRAPNPIVVVEVLSPGTRAVDTGTKLIGYFEVASILHYLIVFPDRRVIIHHLRTADGIATRIVRQGAIVMDPPGLTITVQEVYGVIVP